ncbi:MAG: Lrp/AsnC family transcriptional regulator [Armatimonadetes bacterium]|nr:Lrp/AsnC family transcriptional regulator [Armatimonadota bacterium]
MAVPVRLGGEELREILRILERDARATPEQIAAMIGGDAENVARVIADAEKSGTIGGYKSVIDWDRAGEEYVYAFIDVRVSPERASGFDDIARRIYRFPEVLSAHLVSGQHDLRVTVAGRTMKEVAYFVAEKLATIEQVQSTETHFVLKRYKEDGVIFEEREPDRRLAVAP